MRALVIGRGYIGGVLADQLRRWGIRVDIASRSGTEGTLVWRRQEDLCRLVSEVAYDQVIALGQLASDGMAEVIGCVDGPRWIVFSSQQLAGRVGAPGEEIAASLESHALSNGAGVLRPTMVYGRGKDQNLSRVLRWSARLKVCAIPGDGTQLVQPVHVDDVVALIHRMALRPESGLYPVGGPEAVPISELSQMIRELVGIRVPAIHLPSAGLRYGARLASWFDIRADQVLRLLESKTADNDRAASSFDWKPMPLGQRVEEAYRQLTREAADGA